MAKQNWGIAWAAFVRAGYKCEYCGLDAAITGRWYMYDHDALPRNGDGMLIEVAAAYVAMKRAEREAKWGRDVATILAEAGREY
jgi:hypothetical protein